jgi:hypothetical protein
MDILLPHETELTGRWLEIEGKVHGDAVCKRIHDLTNGVLNSIQDHPKSGGWTRLFRDPADGRYWERTYLQSGLHGGGPPTLRSITMEKVIEEYGFRP